MKWFSGSIPEAVTEAKKNKKLFLVYVEGNDDMSKSMTSSYENAIISQKLSSDDIIALKLAANSVPYVQFCAIYPVLIIPSSYFIGINGAPIEVVTGSLGPTEFAEKIDKIVEIYKKSLPAKKEASLTQPSTSKASEPVLPPKENTASSNEQAASSSEQAASSSEQIASSSEQSASQPPNDSESKASLEERVERAKQLLELKKQLQECEEAEKERKLELERRTVGKALQKKQQEQKEKELQEFARNRAKEKEEERLAREKVKALIAQDRAERAARYQRTKEAENQEAAERTSKMKEEQERAARYAALNSNEARIQFRLPDGSSASNIFSADSSLQEAREYVKNVVRPPFSHFSLCTTFPRRHFTQSDYSQTLRDLQLAPSAVLLILPEQSVTHISSSGGFWSSVIWTLLSPFLYTWRSITSLFSGLFQGRDEPTQPSSESPKTQNESVRSQSADGVRRRDGRYLRQDGNIYRLSNQSDDDGENNTWNGNSTQQM